MKLNKIFAVLMTALFLAPFFAARGEAAPAFTADESTVLRGMERSWAQGYAPSVSREKWEMILPVRSETAAGIVTAELRVLNGNMTPFKQQEMTVTAKEETKGVWGVRFSLAVFSDRKNGDYPCSVHLTGKDSEGREISADIPYTVQIRGATAAAEKTRIRIDGISAELSVGEEGEILVTLANPCAATNIEDLELKISDAAGHILPRDAETLKIGNLNIGESVTVTYPVTVTEKASVAPHVVKLDLNWTALGQQASCSENRTMAVHQEIRLEQGGVKMAPSVTAGDSMTVTLPLMNMGKADVVNVLATLMIPGITERQSVLVGTIQPGETKQAQLVLTPSKDLAGEFSGTLSVEGTDQDGNSASFMIPLELTVERPAPAAAAAGSPDAVKKEEVPYATYGLGGGCALLFAAFLLQGGLLRRKLHRLEEEKL